MTTKERQGGHPPEQGGLPRLYEALSSRQTQGLGLLTILLQLLLLKVLTTKLPRLMKYQNRSLHPLLLLLPHPKRLVHFQISR
jgi:hypothetical protein